MGNLIPGNKVAANQANHGGQQLDQTDASNAQMNTLKAASDN